MESFILSIHTNDITMRIRTFFECWNTFLNGKKYLQALVLRWLLDTSKVEIDGNCFYQSIKRRKQCFLSLALILNQRNQLNDYNFFWCSMFVFFYTYKDTIYLCLRFSLTFSIENAGLQIAIFKARQRIGILHSCIFSFLLIDPSRITTSFYYELFFTANNISIPSNWSLKRLNSTLGAPYAIEMSLFWVAIKPWCSSINFPSVVGTTKVYFEIFFHILIL
jgi:hypothetical protein